MLIHIQQVEEQIHWKLQAGNCSFWWDNCLGNGPLALYTTNNNRFNNSIVAEFLEDGKWSWSTLIEKDPTSQFPNNLAVEFSPQHHLPD